MDHPSLPDDFTHAWLEVSGVILDVTHDQFADTGITGWLFPLDSAWHGQFSSLDRRDGYCTAMNWPSYPKDAYQAALEALTKERPVDPSLTR